MKIKYRILIGLCFCLIITGLNGCTKNNKHGLNPDQPVTLTLWHYYNGSQKEALDDLVTEFNTGVGAENGIMIDAISKGSIQNIARGIQTNLKTVESEKNLPDLFAAYLDTAQPLQEKDKLVSLESYMDEKEIADYVDAYITGGKYDQKDETKIFPIAKANEVLIINKEEWTAFSQQENITEDALTTWEGLAETAEKYYNYSNGKAFFSRDALMNYMLVGASQMKDDLFHVSEQQGSFQISEKTMKKLWDAYYIPFIKGYYSKNGRFASDDMKTLDIISAVSSTAGATFYPKEIVDNNGNSKPISYLVLPVPNFAGYPKMTIVQGAGMAITKTNETREYASIVFLKWLTQAQRNTLFSAKSSYLPVMKEANSFTTWKETLQKEKVEVPPILQDTIRVSFQQIQDTTIYEAVDFNNSYAARSYLENALQEKASTDQKEINKQIANGKQREEVLKTYTNTSNFKQWFHTVKSNLTQLLEGVK